MSDYERLIEMLRDEVSYQYAGYYQDRSVDFASTADDILKSEWLTEHDREQREIGWDEGYFCGIEPTSTREENPYRGAKQ